MQADQGWGMAHCKPANSPEHRAYPSFARFPDQKAVGNKGTAVHEEDAIVIIFKEHAKVQDGIMTAGEWRVLEPPLKVTPQ